MQTQTTEKEYDVIIIGGGVSGLTSAALLSRCGLTVAVVEKEPHLGGYLAGFHRKQFRFDTAIHWLNQYNERGGVTKIFSLFGNDFPRAETMQNIRRIKSQNTDYLLTNNPEMLRQQLIQDFPEDKKGINKFFKAAYKIGKAFLHFSNKFQSETSMSLLQKTKHKLKLLQFVRAFVPHVFYENHKFEKGLNNYFKSEDLKKLFSAENDLLSCLIPIAWAHIDDYQRPPNGGGQVIPEWLAYIVSYYQNSIFTSSYAQKIIVENNICKGVMIKHKQTERSLQGKYILACCDQEVLYNKLLPDGIISQKKKQILADAEIYYSSFTLDIALNVPVENFGFSGEMVHLINHEADKQMQLSADPKAASLTILTPSVHDKTLAPNGKGTLVVFMPAKITDYNNWETEADYKRGIAYKNFKKKIAEELIDRIERDLIPDFRKYVLFYTASTPVTHWRYTHNKDGSMMGTKPCKKNMQSKVASYLTPLPNLFIGGQWAELGGGVPIAVKTGVNAALHILKKEKPNTFRLLSKYLNGKVSLQEMEESNSLLPYDNSWIRMATRAELGEVEATFEDEEDF